MENKDKMSLKEKCKAYQEKANYYLDTEKWIIVHVDGKNFSTMIKNNFHKPFDEDFIQMMNDTATYLCQEVQGVRFAYVQSDEISLAIKKNTPKSDIFFGGRLCKLQSIIAGLASSYFTKEMMIYNLHSSCSDDYLEVARNSEVYQFDCKAWNVDDANDAMAWFLFRNIDCIRNSKQQAAQAYLSHKQLIGKTADEQIELLKQTQNINWGNYFDGWKYGRILEKEDVEMSLGENTFTRSIWKAKDGCDLTITENRNKLFEKYFQAYLER